MASRNKHFQAVLMCALLALPTLAVYWPVTRFGFVNFDDPAYVVENKSVLQGLTWPGVVWAFQTGHSANWHPLTWLSHMLDVQLFGLRAGAHHLVNLLFHVANTTLLFLLFRSMTGEIWRGAFVAALFALHPLHVESVAWVSERKDVLSVGFGLLAVWTYVAYANRVVAEAATTQPTTHNPQPATRFYFMSLVLFAFSLMSKPMLVTLPLLLLLLDYWPLSRIQLTTQISKLKTFYPLLVEKLPFLALAAVSCVLTLRAQKKVGAVASAELVPMNSRVLNAVVAVFAYVAKMFWPAHLAVFYPYPGTQTLGPVALAGAFLVAATVAALRWRRTRPQFIVGWLWFLGTLVPVIGLVQVGSQSMADRCTYIHLIGLFVVLAWAVPVPSRKWGLSPAAPAVAGSLAILACAGVARAQVAHWQDTETLFRHALAVTGGNFVAHGKLGEALAASGKLREAEAELAAAIKINPAYFPAMYDLGGLLRTNGHAAEALTLYNQALQLRPQDATAHYTLAIALSDQQRVSEAFAQYNEALRLDPSFVSAHNNVANLLLSQGNAVDALPHALAALRQKPDFLQAHLNAGNALFLQEKFAEAAAHYAAAAKLDPGNAEARLNLGKALVNQDKLEEAEPHLKAAVRLDPANALEPHQILANILATNPNRALRNGARAVELASRACTLTSSTNATYVETLAAAYAEAGMFTEAISVQQLAADLTTSQGQPAQAASARIRLDLFRSRQPFHEPPNVTARK